MAETILKLSRNFLQFDSKKDFFSDQLHYQITFTILIISAIASTTLQFYADPIQCVQPAQFTDGYTSFARTLCWLNNTYFYPQTYTRLPLSYGERHQHVLRYYQWIPFIYLIQSFFFLFPHLIWLSFFKRNGLNPSALINQGNKYERNRDISKVIAKEIERYLMCRFLARSKKKLIFQQNLTSNPNFSPPSSPTTTSSPLVFPNVSFRIRSHNYFLVFLYLFVKILYLLNIVLQFLFLNSILSTGNYGFIRFGFDTIKYLFKTSIKQRISTLSFQHQQLFPFVTLCDFHIRELGQDHFYTIECVLLINIFYEKIYFALWIWFILLFFITICSFIYSIYLYLTSFARYRFVEKYLVDLQSKFDQTNHVEQEFSLRTTTTTTTTNDLSSERDFLFDRIRRRRFVGWIERDGSFLLHLLETHVGRQLTIDVFDHLIKIWIENYDDKSVLAEKLLKNQFRFT